ncbi:hypothetical protein KAR34_09585, partial [bacterium]|nr:hypothetical protein [bacterium]
AIAKDAYANEAFERSFDFAKKATIYALVAKARTEQKQAEQKLADLKGQLKKVKAQTKSYMQSTPVNAPAEPTMGSTPEDSPHPTAIPTTPEVTQP